MLCVLLLALHRTFAVACPLGLSAVDALLVIGFHYLLSSLCIYNTIGVCCLFNLSQKTCFFPNVIWHIIHPKQQCHITIDLKYDPFSILWKVFVFCQVTDLQHIASSIDALDVERVPSVRWADLLCSFPRYLIIRSANHTDLTGAELIPQEETDTIITCH